MIAFFDLYLEYGQDLKLMCRTSVQSCTGWDRVRQRIIRRVVTNPAQQLPDGNSTNADYIFDGSYGFGLGSMVAQSFSDAYLAQVEQRIAAGVLADAAVVTTIPPSIKFYRPNPQEVVATIGVTLVTGEQGQVSLQLTQPSAATRSGSSRPRPGGGGNLYGGGTLGTYDGGTLDRYG